MLWITLIAALTVVTAYHAATYLLWLFETRRRGAAQARQPLAQQVTAWIAEGAALLTVIVAWPLGAFGKPKTTSTGERRPVVLVHGWSLNRASMALLAARLRRDGRDAYAVNYPSLHKDTDAKARHLAETLRRIAEETGSPRLDILAHSLGGVLVRAAARYHGSTELLGNVVTLGAPHGGSALTLLFGGMGLRQLRPGSRYLERLSEDDDLPSRVHFVAISSSFDAIVFPLSCSDYPAAMNVTLHGIGHHGLLFSERVYTIAKENLDLPPKEAHGGGSSESA